MIASRKEDRREKLSRFGWQNHKNKLRQPLKVCHQQYFISSTSLIFVYERLSILAESDIGDLGKHVYIACEILGIDANHMLWLIKEWTERNRTFHNQTRQYISDCYWPRIAERLCRDLKELPNVAPPDTAKMYQNVLLRMLRCHES